MLQYSCGNHFSFVKDSKGLVESLNEQSVAQDGVLVSLNVNALFTLFLYPYVSKQLIENSQNTHKEQIWIIS